MQIKYPSDEAIIALNIGCEDWFDYFNKITKNTDFEYIQYGSAYDDEEMKCAIIFNKKYNKTLNLQPLKDKFDDFIKSTIIETVGNFGIVGGLEES